MLFRSGVSLVRLESPFAAVRTLRSEPRGGSAGEQRRDAGSVRRPQGRVMETAEGSRRTGFFGTTPLGGGSSHCSGVMCRKLHGMGRAKPGNLRRVGSSSEGQMLAGKTAGKVSSRWWRLFWWGSPFAEIAARRNRLRLVFAGMSVALCSRLSPARNSEMTHRDKMAAFGWPDWNGAAQWQSWTWSFGFLREHGQGAGDNAMFASDTGWTVSARGMLHR